MTILTWPSADMVVDQGNRKAVANPQYIRNRAIGRRLQGRRRSFGISERKLCDNLGIYRDDLDAYEHGEKRVTANSVASDREAVGRAAGLLLPGLYRRGT